MKAKNLNIAELLEFSKGFVGLQGRRLLIHDLYSMAQFRRDLIETLGSDLARRILTRKGLFWGQADAAAMQRIYQWENAEEWIQAGSELSMISGMATSELSITSFNETTGTIELEVICTNSSEVEEYRGEMGKSAGAVCWVMVGYLSGYVSYCLGKSVYFFEKQCQAVDARQCVFVGRDVDSWGNDIEKHLPYFHAADIQKKVRELSLRIKNQQRALIAQRKQLKASAHLDDIVGGVAIRSKSFRTVFEVANRVAPFDTTVLITGETGVGKEVIARHIHQSSPRQNGPFIAVNCSALPESLLESELFGHRAGSFTGANSNKVGLFESAENGTIFLDEIGDISLTIQAKLLRVLQSGEIRPVGETKTRIVNVRVISATNRNLDQLAQQGAFRRDLLYRLKVVHIPIPPLRERVDDILPLARHFLEQFKRRLAMPLLTLCPATLDVLMNYSWPGNVRELQNALEHASVLCSDGNLTPEALPASVNGRHSMVSFDNPRQTLEKLEDEHIHRVLELTKGNRSAAAKILGIGEATLYRRLKKNRGTRQPSLF